MAIEDGYYLAKSPKESDLQDLRAVRAGFGIYEKPGIELFNHNMEFTRFLGRMYHSLPWPLAKLRDLIFDYTPLLSCFMRKGYL